ncbi:MAG: DNA polymerase/3'-5' exonuclease PolX [Planctomycetota bacterium]|nr:DNA polymerase/3'-5' exonuclease PolX [Planctomycetota bacterium]MDA1105132.1 DNA polymerase/3'-5' exonuclease PolX [Planctomycetota bacterium]
MSSNDAIAAHLSHLGDLLELTGANVFRVNAMRRASRSAEGASVDLARLAVSEPKALSSVDGIGEGIAARIVELVTTGKCSEEAKLAAQVPPGVPALLQLPGLGPKKVRRLWQEAGVEDISSLTARIDDGTIAGMTGFGAKSVANLKDAIAFQARGIGRFRLDVGWREAHRLLGLLAQDTRVLRTAFAGSLRRNRDTIGDVDLLVAADDALPLMDRFCAAHDVERTLARGDTKASVRLLSGLQVDLRVLPLAQFGAALLYFTGSKEHNVALRGRAQDRGLTLNEYGLFPDDGEAAPHTRGVKAVAAATEEEIYAALETPFLPPELREVYGDAPLAAPPAGLLELSHIVCELHSHTTASDGAMTIEELARAAKARGFHTIAVTDHSKSSAIANGLSVERLRAHITAIHAARSRVPGIQILAGSEVDILADGSLDYSDDLLEALDIVVASPHTSLSQDPETATRRLLRAIEHPAVDIIGHPTGRVILERPGLEPDIETLAKAAAARGVALEINAHPARLDLRDSHVRMALAQGALIAIDCDVHHEEDFDNLSFGVGTGRRGGLTKDRCVNGMSADALQAWLSRAGSPRS